MAEEKIPFRKTTNLAVDAAFKDFQASLLKVAEAAIEDGEATREHRFDVDARSWVKTTPDIKPEPEPEKA